MTYLAIFVFIFALIRLLIIAFNYGQWLKQGEVQETPLVSVLIPARNEESNIGSILSDIHVHDYKNLEVVVYDDLSEDKTFEIAHSFALKDSRFQVVKGKTLPGGWMGKNHACHQLSLHAQGDYLLFLDADVHVRKGLIRNAVVGARRHHLDLLSIFPVQQMNTLAERIVVPLMNWILVSLLPLGLVRATSLPSLAAANGQFMFFRAETYRKELFHKTLKESTVEDIAISRYMKQMGYKVQTLLGNRQIQCRMYRSWPEAVNGFSRSLFHFFGGSKLLAFFFALITTFGFLAVIFYLPPLYILIYFLVVILQRILISIWSRQNIFYNFLLSPLQQVSLLYILVYATLLQYKKATRWKGRLIND